MQGMYFETVGKLTDNARVQLYDYEIYSEFTPA